MFLDDSYLKYVGWTLYDRVRNFINYHSLTAAFVTSTRRYIYFGAIKYLLPDLNLIFIRGLIINISKKVASMIKEVYCIKNVHLIFRM